MRKLRRSLTLLAFAALMLFAGTSAEAATGYNGLPIYAVPAHHYAFTWGGYDYSFQGTDLASKSNQTCVGHSDLVKRRVVLCPWCSWTFGWIPHCTQV
jgi:hypothetical protein